MSTLSRRRLLRLIAVSVVLGVAFLASAWRNAATEGAPQPAEVGDSVTSYVIGEDQAVVIDEEMPEDEDMLFVDIQDEEAISNTGNPAVVTTNATVVHVVDGDTFDADLDGVGKVRIRMLGVNTPETVDPRKAVECFGKDASDFSKSVLREGSRIRLDADAEADERDKYGRLLRNVILADGTDVNARLVAEGYAYAYTSFPLAPERKAELIRLEREAKEAERGLWGSTCR